MRTSSALTPGFRNSVRLRLTARGRVVIALLIAALLIAGLALGGFFAGTPSAAAGSQSAVAYTSVTVAEGENMWDIVAPYTPKGYDVRDYILLVQEVNDLETTVVHPGQVLELPRG